MTNFTNVLDEVFEMPNATRSPDTHTEETVEYILYYAAVDVVSDTIDSDKVEMDIEYHRDGLSVTFYKAGFPHDDSEVVSDGMVLRIDKPDTSCHSLIESLREQVQERLTVTAETLTVHITVPVIKAMVAEMESLRALISKIEGDFNITPTEAVMAMAKEGMAGKMADTIATNLSSANILTT
jgi:hypothetical protein